jgi:multidrug efflux pump subunit AcrA (membrane-fusion protein)
VVFVVGQDNKVQLRTITLGDRFESYYIVTEGLKAGETIVTDGIQKVRPGAAVIPTDKPATAEKAGQKN